MSVIRRVFLKCVVAVLRKEIIGQLPDNKDWYCAYYVGNENGKYFLEVFKTNTRKLDIPTIHHIYPFDFSDLMDVNGRTRAQIADLFK
ncbi:hypothetical protein [Niallia oryzisoli]|uniref:hypothetical protein n=1 Tax=Niallia oryzisoli TaxID=1737571 RepID=UPI0037368EF0